MKFTAKLNLPELDVRAFKTKLDRELSDLLIEAATAWLEAGVFEVPVWSGAARSTFADLAARLNFSIAVSPVATAPDRRALGRSQGEGRLLIDKTKGTYGFEYSTTLDHLIENETGTSTFPNLKTPTPYNFRLAALRAWEEVARKSSLPGLRVSAKGRVFQ
jgi:hypothetical protein